jgi:hypothetical protein
MKAGGSFIFAGVGRFTVDGAGNVTNGELDVNSTQSPGPVVIEQIFSGTYAVGVDNRGVMTWVLPPDSSGAQIIFAKLQLTIRTDGSASFSLFDPVAGRAEFGIGTFEQADTTAYNTAKIKGDYAFGVAGFDHSNNRAALVGRLTSDGAGNFNNVDAVMNGSSGANSTMITLASYGMSDTVTGRGTMRLTTIVGLMPSNVNFVFYIVNSGKLFVLSTDAYAVSSPLLSGSIVRQQIPAGGFSSGSLSGGMVVYLSGSSVCSTGTSPKPAVLAGVLNPGTNGAISLTYDENCGGIATSASNQLGTYTVEADGHACITVGTASVAYLVSPNRGFFLSTDTSVFFGYLEPQSAGPLTNSSVTGAYAGFTGTIAPFNGSTLSGQFTADGVSPEGTLTGTVDTVHAKGPDSGLAANATYSVAASPTNGRGTTSATSGPWTNSVIYVISPSKFVAMPVSDANPSMLLFEQ